MTKSRNLIRKRHKWSQVDDELLRRNYANSLTSDLAQVIGVNYNQVCKRAMVLGLKKDPAWVADSARERSSRTGHPFKTYGFMKGNVPANKGKKMPDGWAPGRMAQTQFVKGQVSHNLMPVGSFRVNDDGYLDLKVSADAMPVQRRWKAYHRVVWEAAHGPVPKGSVVAFKPGMRTTDPARITLDVLEQLTFAENLARMLAAMPKPLMDLHRLRGILSRQINRKAKES